MRTFLHLAIRVFAKPEEDQERIREGLLALLPFDPEKEKIKIEERKAQGFNERKITVFTIDLEKQRHLRAVSESLIGKMDSAQKKRLLDQMESRLDQELKFFIRIDKKLWSEERIIQLTDGGDCYHFSFTVAAYPRNRENAIESITKFFKVVEAVNDR